MPRLITQFLLAAFSVVKPMRELRLRKGRRDSTSSQIVYKYYPQAAVIICQWNGGFCSVQIEGIEPPHSHPEAPSDKILTDFFVPNRMYTL